MLIAAAVLLLTVWNATGFYQGDEHFQVLEFAAHKVGFVAGADLPWEFAEQMRPALQPFLAYVVYQALTVFGEVNPFFMAGLLRLFSAVLYLGVAVALYRRYAPTFSDATNRKWLALALLFSWCNVFAGVRFASESWSGAMFVFGLLAYPLPPVLDKFALSRVSGNGGKSSALWAGVLFGLSFEFRYQMALAVVGFVAWLLFVGKPNWKYLGLLIVGGLTVVGVGTLIDRWFYNEWVFAPWNYLAQNLIEGKAAGFGTKPWYGYIEYIFERGIPPLSLVYLAATGWFCWRYRKDPITWSFLFFFVAHSALSRKDIRFMFPMLPFLSVALVVSLRDLKEKYGTELFDSGWPKRGLVLAIVINVALLVSVCVRSMNDNTHAMRYVYDNYSEPVTLFADGRHVFSLSHLVIRFYQRRGGVIIIEDENRNWSACETSMCLYSERTNTPDPPPGGTLVYTNEIAFLGDFDPFGLVSRQPFWYVYELKRKEYDGPAN